MSKHKDEPVNIHASQEVILEVPEHKKPIGFQRDGKVVDKDGNVIKESKPLNIHAPK